jgi:hypothetical protein
MAIQARQRINQIGRISEDKVEGSVDTGVEIALDNLNVGHAVKVGIKLAKPKCTQVDIRKGDNRPEPRRQ